MKKLNSRPGNLYANAPLGDRKKSHRKGRMKAAAVTLSFLLVFPGSMPVLASGSANPQKDENVYVNLNQDGSVNGIYVVNDYLLDEDTQITDYGKYESVKNLTSNEEIKVKGNTITTQAKAGKFFYQGNLKSKDIPWDISIGYYLDGKEIRAEDLAGANGKLKIKLHIGENKDLDSEFFDHYLLQATVTMDMDKCSHLQAAGATVGNVGSNKQLLYNIMAGQEKDIDITADVLDFEMDPISIQGVPMSFDIDKDTFDMTSLYDQTDEIKNAADEFDDGADQLADGTNSMKEGAADLRDGVNSLLDGITDYTGGASDLGEGVGTLQEKLPELTDGAGELADGINSAKDGARQLASGVNGDEGAAAGAAKLADGAGKLKEGAVQVDAGVKQMVTELSTMPVTLNAAVDVQAKQALESQQLQGAINALNSSGVVHLELRGSSYKDKAVNLQSDLDSAITSASGTRDTALNTVKGMLEASGISLGENKKTAEEETEPETEMETETETETEMASEGDAASDSDSTGGGTEGNGRPDDGTEDSGTPDDSAENSGTPDGSAGDSGTPDGSAGDGSATDDNTGNGGKSDSTGNGGKSEDGTEESGKPNSGSGNGGKPETSSGDSGKSDRSAANSRIKPESQSDNGTNAAAEQETETTQLRLSPQKFYYRTGTLREISRSREYGAISVSSAGIPKPSEVVQKAMDLNQLIDTLQMLKEQVDKLVNAYETVDSISSSLSGSMDLSQLKLLTDGTAALSSGLGDLSKGAGELANGMNQLADGANQLESGLSQLSDGGVKLADGTKELQEGVDDLKEGVDTLNEASPDLRDGGSQLLDGTGDLLEGTVKLADGVADLKDGTLEFKDKTGDIDGKVDEEIDKVVNDFSGKDYETQSFVSDRNTNVDLVQFAMKTEGISIKEAEKVETVSEPVSFWERILNLFR